MNLDLFENALTSITHGLEHYAKGFEDQINYKFSILHVEQGIELLLKERLSRDDPNLIFAKPQNRGGKTIDFEETVERLERCYLDLSENIKDLRALKKARNDIEHYKCNVSEKQATTLIGNVIPFLIDFLKDELETSLQDSVETEVWQELLLIQGVHDMAIQQADKEIAGLQYDEKEGGYHPVWTCAQCGESYMVEDDQSANGEHQAKCLLCNHTADLIDCWKCGEPFPEDDSDASAGLCGGCVDYMNQDYT